MGRRACVRMCVCMHPCMRWEGPIAALISSLSGSVQLRCRFLLSFCGASRDASQCPTERRGIDELARGREGGSSKRLSYTCSSASYSTSKRKRKRATRTQTHVRAREHFELCSSHSCTRIVFVSLGRGLCPFHFWSLEKKSDERGRPVHVRMRFLSPSISLPLPALPVLPACLGATLTHALACAVIQWHNTNKSGVRALMTPVRR